MKKSNVLVLVNEVKDVNFNFTKKVAKFLIEHNCCVYIENEYVSHVPSTKEYVKGEINIDFALILGGDGTLLNYAHVYCDVDFPFFGVNLGRVGCLTEATVENWEEKLEEILKGNYFIEELSLDKIDDIIRAISEDKLFAVHSAKGIVRIIDGS